MWNTYYGDKSRYWSEYGNLAITGILLWLTLLSGGLLARAAENFDTPDSGKHDGNYSSTLWVATGAKIISIPASTDGVPYKKTWLLKASGYGSTIALFMIEAAISATHDTRFRLEARDGFRSDSPLLGSCRFGDDVNFNWSVQVKAKSGFLLLEFVNEGLIVPQFRFAYCLCGGVIMPTSHIVTPYFPWMYSKHYPGFATGIVDCEWTLHKAADATHGSITVRNVTVTDCSSLHMRSDASMKVYEKPDPTPMKFPSALLSLLNLTSKSKLKQQRYFASDTVNSNLTVGKEVVHPICGNHIKMILFEGGSTSLRYISTPHSSPEFIGDFGSVRVPKLRRKKTNTVHWFFNYCHIVVFIPIGITIGLVIICRQSYDLTIASYD